MSNDKKNKDEFLDRLQEEWWKWKTEKRTFENNSYPFSFKDILNLKDQTFLILHITH